MNAMNDDLSMMTQAQKDALAARALKSQEKARQRSEAYRDRKKGSGMVQVSVWVPEARAAELRRAFQKHVEKIMTQPQG
jgi:vacuolar-type H+-ATPase subunit I/STV1